MNTGTNCFYVNHTTTMNRISSVNYEHHSSLTINMIRFVIFSRAAWREKKRKQNIKGLSQTDPNRQVYVTKMLASRIFCSLHNNFWNFEHDILYRVFISTLNKTKEKTIFIKIIRNIAAFNRMLLYQFSMFIYAWNSLKTENRNNHHSHHLSYPMAFGSCKRSIT